MSLKTPSIVTGARGPRDVREKQAKAEAAEPEPERGAGEIPADEVWFQSSYTKLRVQLTAPQDERLPDGRYKHTVPIVAQFDGAMLKLKRTNKKHARTIELLLEHPRYGTLFWNFQDVLDQKEEKEREQAVKVLQDPKQRALIAEMLRAEGMEIPLPGQTKSAAKKNTKAGGDGSATSDE